MELVSPDGKTKVVPHPSKVESMINLGWKEEVKKTRAKSNKTEAQVNEIQDEEESE